MKIIKNKIFLSICAVLLVIILFVITIKVINTNSQDCKIDSDCTFYEKSCCYACGPGDSVNKDFLTTLKMDKSINCLFGLRSIPCNCFGTCPYDCKEMGKEEPFCNQDNKCDTSFNCEKTCENWQGRILEYTQEKQERVKKNLFNETGCVCDFKLGEE